MRRFFACFSHRVALHASSRGRLRKNDAALIDSQRARDFLAPETVLCRCGCWLQPRRWRLQSHRGMTLKSLDPRLRGDDGLGETQRKRPLQPEQARPTRLRTHRETYLPSFPRTRALLYFGEAEHPGLHRSMALKPLDPRLRGDDELKSRGETDLPRNLPTVIPAKAGIQGVTEA